MVNFWDETPSIMFAADNVPSGGFSLRNEMRELSVTFAEVNAGSFKGKVKGTHAKLMFIQ